jgi:hypothetical protein
VSELISYLISASVLIAVAVSLVSRAITAIRPAALRPDPVDEWAASAPCDQNRRDYEQAEIDALEELLDLPDYIPGRETT